MMRLQKRVNKAIKARRRRNHVQFVLAAMMQIIAAVKE